MSIRKALGAVKDQTTISIAKVTGAVSPDLDVAVVRATSHDDAPADDRHAAHVLRLTSNSSRAHVAACVASLARRLARTRDYVVAAKCLALVHRLVVDGDPAFRHELLRPAAAGRRAGEPLLSLLVDFRDEAHSASWDHSAFVRAYAAYLDARVHFLVSLLPPPRAVHFADDPVHQFSSPPQSSSTTTMTLSVHEMDPDALLTRSRQLRHLLDRVLACRPTGAARTSRVVLQAALYPILKDSFQVHADVAVVLAVLLDRFFDMEYQYCVKAFEAYVGAAKQIDELLAFYAWCRDVGVARAADFPTNELNRIDDKLLETLEQFLRERGRAVQNHNSEPAPTFEHRGDDRRLQNNDLAASAECYDDMNGVKALPAPPSSAPTAQKKAQTVAPANNNDAPDDLVDLREPSADDQGNKLALALFNAPAPTNGDWVAFPSDGDDKVTSAWQTPAAEPGKADWELALVETASNLSRHKAALGGGMDALLLGGMYDQGAVRRHVAVYAASSGSASSVAAFPGRQGAPVLLALPAPDGTMQTVGGGDPFAASLAVPPPAYVQMAEMERKQELLLQEQRMWAQYRQGGMQGQLNAGGSVFASNTSVAPMLMPYGMPAVAYNQVGGYYKNNSSELYNYMSF